MPDTEIHATISFNVTGKPAPQGSKRLISGRILDDSIHLASWRNAVAVTAHDQHVPMFTDAVIVGLMFRLVRPRSVTVKRRRLPQVPPDLDKLMRSTFDGLVMGQLLVDDALVCSVWASKRYCAEDELPGCEIVIEALP